MIDKLIKCPDCGKPLTCLECAEEYGTGGEEEEEYDFHD
jgi:hypothetical protein